METLKISDLSILVLEPSAMQAKIIEGHLNELSVSDINSEGSGADALNSMRSHKPDLVISSMYLPDMTGTDVVQAMRQDDNLEDVPFMLISSETSFNMLDPIRQAGVIAILPKPFEPNALKRALYNTLDFIAPDNDEFADVNLEELRVLLVDDSLTARKHMGRVLGNLGIEDITFAKNGKEASEIIESNFFDFIVTDFNMPEMDGAELIEHVRNKSTQSSIPILMVTSESDNSRLAAVQQSGVSGICDKPFEPSTVKEYLRHILTEI